MKKEDILERVSASDIYLRYLRLPKFPGGNISSPFSEDKKPSFKLYQNGTFKCFSTGKHGDVWQFVAELKNLNCQTQFKEVLNAIVNDLQIISIAHSQITSVQKATVSNSKKSQLDDFEIETIPLSVLHYNYFNQFGIGKETLEYYNVKAVRYFQFWQESKQRIVNFPIRDNVIAVTYELNGRYEIYIPEQAGASSQTSVSKFFYNLHNAEDIFGLDQLPLDVDHIIICAGKKDALTLASHGYYAVSFRSENHTPSKDQIDKLSEKLHHEGNLFICYDNDFNKSPNPGQVAQARIVEQFPFIHPINLPGGINDIAELYQKGQNIDTSYNEARKHMAALKLQQQLNNETRRTIFHIAEEYIDAHYEIRYNTIKLEIQSRKITAYSSNCNGNDHVWKKINENSLFVEMQKKAINISVDKLVAILKSDFTPEYNPISNYFRALPSWNPQQPDWIAKLSTFVQAKEPAQFLRHFKKWLVRTVKCALIPEYFNKQAFILVSPTQNDGKSTFCRFLCPPDLGDYIAEDITNDKDARILLCRNFLINLDELAVLSKQEINSLKAFFSKTQINERLPYDRTNSIIPRIASFIGSTNQDEFLADETGSVRWLCFAINRIDWRYKKEIDINSVWAQALFLMNDPTFESELTKDDIIENELRNKDFQILSIERELISKAFRIPLNRTSEGVFLTATEIMQHIIATEIVPARGLSKIAIGRAMKQEGYEREKQFGVYGYCVQPVKSSGLPMPTLSSQASFNNT